MPRKKKPPTEWTTDEAMRKLFPPSVLKKVDREIEKEPNPQVKPSVESIEDDDK
jgi:hypothetical protein